MKGIIPGNKSIEIEVCFTPLIAETIISEAEVS